MKTLTLEQASLIRLIKWPELLVKGKSVTGDQAHEIIIRTSGLSFSCNDQRWENGLKREVLDACGMWSTPTSDFGYHNWDTLKRKFGILDLSYLQNDRIASSYIGGPDGWCNWDGTIQAYGKNIGKWPGVESVYGDWCAIAKAFPFLSLRCQLVNMEHSEEAEQQAQHEVLYDEKDDPKFPVVEFSVHQGEVEIREPDEKIIDVKKPFDPMTLMHRFNNPNAERGCTIDMFKKGLTLAAERDVPVLERLERAAVDTYRIARGWRNGLPPHLAE